MTDERLEQMVGTLLRVGVLSSAFIVLAGGVWWLVEKGRSVPAYHQFHAEPTQLRSIFAVLGGLGHLQPETLIQFGLLVLIATPLARVALAWLAFVLERDRTYVVLTLIVLAVLLYSLAQSLRAPAVQSPGEKQGMNRGFTAAAGYQATGLRSTPMFSISTSTMSPAESLRVAPGVPVKMRSPGMRVTHRLTQLTMVAQSKMKSAVRSF